MLKKLLVKTYYILCVLLFAWIFFSFVDIAWDNCCAAVHSVYNFFDVCLEVFN